MKKAHYIAVATSILLVTSSVQAHAPRVLLAGVPFQVEDTTISYALYGTFNRPDDLFTVRLSFAEDFAFPIEVFVPHRSSLAEHRPAYAIVGPGLPRPSEEALAALPRPLPAGAGAIVDLNTISPRPAFYESYTRRFFWSSGIIAVVLQKGDYEVWIWSPRGTTGKFVLGFGVEERVDFGKVFEDWATYAY